MDANTQPRDIVLLDEHQVADLTAMSVSTLRRWRSERRGQGPQWRKLGRSVRYARADVVAWLETCRRS